VSAKAKKSDVFSYLKKQMWISC